VVSRQAGRIAAGVVAGEAEAGPALRPTVRSRVACLQALAEHSVYVDPPCTGAASARRWSAPFWRSPRSRRTSSWPGVGQRREPAPARALGFKEVAHIPEVGFKFGRWLDLKFLQIVRHAGANGILMTIRQKSYARSTLAPAGLTCYSVTPRRKPGVAGLVFLIRVLAGSGRRGLHAGATASRRD
jgi:L-amino acid N-acyltransferase YncA